MATANELIERARRGLIDAHRDFEADSAYYEARVRLRALGTAIPPQMQHLTASVGWPRMYLDSIEDRIGVMGFRLPGDSLTDDRLRDWWQTNDLDEESGLAHLEALIHGRCYITVAAPGPLDPPGIPVIRVESPRHLWVETDPRTREVTSAVRFYTDPGRPLSDDHPNSIVTVYLPDSTTTYRQIRGGGYRRDGDPILHGLGVVPVVPMLNRERVSDRNGRSEILPEVRSMTDMATRTLMAMQAAAEIMAVPQRLLFGVEKDEIAPGSTDDPAAKYKAYMANILAFASPEGKAFQFNAAELRNFVEALQEMAKQVASYTGLPPQYLSFSSENPASAEAIQASESRLVKKCESKGKMFGNAWERVMRIGMKIIDGNVPDDALRLEAVMVDPGTPTLAAKADAVMKYFANGSGIIPEEFARKLAGFSDLEIEQMAKMDESDPRKQLNAIMGEGNFDLAQITGSIGGQTPAKTSTKAEE